ncbi:hypothetical protein FRC04_010485 [Tulasnella sp. 424]|nr:hypothetical protein FRC04_010485 [Tulasnella sp. 424]
MALDALAWALVHLYWERAKLRPKAHYFPGTSDEVENLKTRLAASEAFVKQLTKEKFEAVDTSRELWLEIKACSMAGGETSVDGKLGLLDEAEATPGLLPSSEEVWFAGSNQTPPQTQPPLLSPISMSRDHRNPETPPSETHQVPEVTVGQPAASGRAHAEPLVSEVDIKDDEAPERIGSIFLASTPADDHDGCDPGNALSPASTPMPPYPPPSIPLLQASDSRRSLSLFCICSASVNFFLPTVVVVVLHTH